MRRILLIAAAACLSLAASAQDWTKAVSRVEHHTLPSEVLGCDRNYTVFLPAGYDLEKDRRYPILYLLHGMSDTDRNWYYRGHVRDVMDQLAADGQVGPMIIVTPDAGGMPMPFIEGTEPGTGYGIIAHASARTDHPVRQSSWGWGEVFTTLIVCTVTGLSIVLTNVYIDYPEVDSSALTTVAFEVAYGPIGGGFLAAAITIFAWTTIIGMYYSCAKSVNYAFGDTLANRRATKVYMVYYMIPCVFFYNIQADALWAMTDLLSAAYVAITLLFIFTQQKEIFRLFHDFWDRYIPAKERGEDPAPVTFGTIDEKAEKESV